MMLYPSKKGYTPRTMAATLRKLKKRRRVPQLPGWANGARWRCWREDFSESAKFVKRLNRRGLNL